jgi:hypothetical protein
VPPRMPRFVVLEHDHPALHWDLLLEAGEVLRSWRLSGLPRSGLIVDAEPSFDHRRIYLDYEGPVSGGRGWVRRWDAGNYEIVAEPPGALLILFSGSHLRGRACLTRKEASHWQLVYEPTAAVAKPPSE